MKFGNCNKGSEYIVNSLKIKDNSKDFKDEIQPRFVFRLNLKGKDEEQIFKEFHQKTRYNIRLATKKGVIIKVKNCNYFCKIIINKR